MRKLYTVLLCIVLALMLAVGVYSLVDKDATFSALENKKLAEQPRFTVAGLLDGSYISAVETYYSDTFPGREALLKLNRSLNKFYYFSGTDEDSVLIINGPSGAELGGESLDAAQNAQNDAQTQTPDTQTPQPDDTQTDQTQTPDNTQLPDDQMPDAQQPEDRSVSPRPTPKLPQVKSLSLIIHRFCLLPFWDFCF